MGKFANDVLTTLKTAVTAPTADAIVSNAVSAKPPTYSVGEWQVERPIIDFIGVIPSEEANDG